VRVYYAFNNAVLLRALYKIHVQEMGMEEDTKRQRQSSVKAPKRKSLECSFQKIVGRFAKPGRPEELGKKSLRP